MALIPSNWVRLGAVFLALLGTANNAPAGLVAEDSWQAKSSNGKFKLVMVSPVPLKEMLEECYCDDDEIAEIRHIDNTYNVSGLYEIDGSTEPLWTVNYLVPCYRPYISDDGRYLVMESLGCSQNTFEVAQFYGNGNFLALYDEADLIRFLHGKVLVGRLFQQEIYKESTVFDPTLLTYTYQTSIGDRFVFDVKDGRLISYSSPWTRNAVLIFFTSTALVGFFWRWRPDLSIGASQRVAFRFTLRDAAIGTAVVCSGLVLGRLSLSLCVLVSVVFVVGAGIACLASVSLKLWWLGGIVATWAAFAGFLVASAVGHILLSNDISVRSNLLLALYLALPTMSGIVAALATGHLKGKPRIVQNAVVSSKFARALNS